MNDEMAEGAPGDLTRREVLRRAAGAGVGLAIAGGISGSLASEALAATPPKRGGTLRVGIGGGGSDLLDPDFSVHEYPAAAAQASIWDTLMSFDDAGNLRPGLATSMEANAKATVWTIRLRQGVKWHNGKPFVADDVIASLQRKVSKGSTSSSSFAFLNGATFKKLDRRTVRVTLKAPYATFREVSAYFYAFITPVGYDPKSTPIGTGPFINKSYKVGTGSSFVRNPDYWGTGPYVNALQLLTIADDTARTNALLSGQVDAIQGAPPAQVPAIKGAGNRVVTGLSGGFYPFVMNCSVAPFNDVRVRQAMRLLVDRREMVRQALQGYGQAGNDVFGFLDPAYDKTLKRQQDIPRARALLKAAGQENLRVELSTAALLPGIMEASQVLAAQAAEAGVTVTLRRYDTTSFWNKYLEYPFSVSYWGSGWGYLDRAALGLAPGADYNETHFSDPEYNALYVKATQTPNTKKRQAIVRQLMKIDFERGGNIIWSYPYVVDAASPKVVGLKPGKALLPMRNFSFNLYSFA